MKCTRLLCLLGVAVLLMAVGQLMATPVSENFNGLVKTGYTPDSTWNGFRISNTVCDTIKAYGGTGRTLRLRNSATPNQSYVEYIGADSMGHDGGVGTFSFIWRGWNTSAVTYKVAVQVNGGTYDTVGTLSSTDTSTFYTFSYALNNASDNIRIKIVRISGERLMVDNFEIADYSAGDVTPPAITSVTVISITQLDVLFSEPVEQTTAETEANYVVTPGGTTPSLATRDGGNIALVHLTFGASLPLGTDTLTVNAVEDTSANQNACSNISQTFVIGSVDFTPPGITLLTVVSKTALDVLFNEAVDQTTAETEANYTVAPGSINPSSALRDGGNIALVHLTFASNLPAGHDTLTVNAVEDTSANNNACSNLVRYFSIPIAEVGDVVINEIMYDDTASTDVEWAELYNRTASAIDLSYWLVLDAPAYPVANEGAFYLPPGTSIAAGGYLVVSKVAIDEIAGEMVGTAFFGGGWGLGNSGDNVGLYSDTVGGLRMDGYATASTLLWYPDWTPNNAGASLEKCVENSPWPADSTGWHVSTNWYSHTGRFRFCTPGATNTVCPDVTAPTIDSVIVETPSVIVAVFTEPMRVDSAQVAAHYSVNLGIGSPTTALIVGNNGGNKVRLTFGAAMPANVYTLTVNNVMDLSNNLIAANSQKQFTVGTPEFSIVFNEVMPNPAAVADASGEWFEIYNAGASPVDMTGWQVSDGEGTFTITAATLTAGDYFVFCCNADSATNGGVPEDYVYTYASGTGLQLNNTADDITLRTGGGSVVATVAYTTSFPWGSGWSMQLKDPSYNPGMDTSWCPAEQEWVGSSGDAGTPGAATICPAAFVPDTITLCSLRVRDSCGVPIRNHVRQVTRGVFSYIDTCKATGYLQSGGCAVAVYGGALFDSMQGATRYPQAGDSVMIDGYISQFRGLTEIQTYAGWTPVVTLLDSDLTVTAVVMDCAIIGLHGDSCAGEAYESEIVQVLNVQFISPSDTFPLADSNFALTCGSDTIIFRLDSCDVALIGTAIPTGPVNITAVVGQYDSVGCACQGYQLQYASGTTFVSAQCAQPESLTVIRDGSSDDIVLHWQAGAGQTCDCYEIYWAADATTVWPTGYTYLAHVVGSTTYTDNLGAQVRRFYRVTAGGPHCP